MVCRCVAVSCRHVITSCWRVLVPPPRYRAVALSCSRVVILSHRRGVLALSCHRVITSHCHVVVLLRCHVVVFSRLAHRRVTVLSCHRVMLSRTGQNDHACTVWPVSVLVLGMWAWAASGHAGGLACERARALVCWRRR